MYVNMKKILALVVVLVLGGVGCVAQQPAQVVTSRFQIYGRIVTVDGSVLTINENDPNTGKPTANQMTVEYTTTTRFAVPDGSGIGAPITKPQIEPGLQVDIQGVARTLPNRKTERQADNIIFIAE